VVYADLVFVDEVWVVLEKLWRRCGVGEGDGVGGFVVFWGVDSWSCHNNGLNMVDAMCEEGWGWGVGWVIKVGLRRRHILSKKKKTFFGQFARSDKERVDFVVRIEFWGECEVFMW
jgi:hypothetical protein